MKGYSPTNIKFETANTNKTALSLELGIADKPHKCTEECTKEKCKYSRLSNK